MKILAGILISLYLGLTLFGLYQYKAHNRSWGMKLVVWMAAVTLILALTMQIGQYLYKRSRWPLHMTAMRGQTERARALMAKGVKVNIRDRDDWTPLHYAILEGRSETATASEIKLANKQNRGYPYPTS